MCVLCGQTQGSYPDGHRAPVLELLQGAGRSGSRTVDTQTPSEGHQEHHDSSRFLLINEDIGVSSGTELTEPRGHTGENQETCICGTFEQTYMASFMDE